MKPVGFFQHWNQLITSCPIPQCLRFKFRSQRVESSIISIYSNIIDNISSPAWRPACQTLWKAFDISSATARIAPDLLKATGILSDTTARRLRRPKTILEIRKKGKCFTNPRKKTNRMVVFSSRPSPTFLNTGNTSKAFQQPGKHDSFRHIWKSSANMFESSGAHFFRTTPGIKSGPDASDE